MLISARLKFGTVQKLEAHQDNARTHVMQKGGNSEDDLDNAVQWEFPCKNLSRYKNRGRAPTILLYD